MTRDRHWIEVTLMSNPQAGRIEMDVNKIEGEPAEAFVRHTPPLDRSGELWLPGWPRGE